MREVAGVHLLVDAIARDVQPRENLLLVGLEALCERWWQMIGYLGMAGIGVVDHHRRSAYGLQRSRRGGALAGLENACHRRPNDVRILEAATAVLGGRAGRGE